MPADTLNVTAVRVRVVPDHVGQTTARVTNRGAVNVTGGGPDVVAGDGVQIAAGEREEFDLAPGETLWLVCAAGQNADCDVEW